MSAIFDQHNPYGQQAGYGGGQGSSSGGGANNLQFYSGSGGQYDGYGGSGNLGGAGSGGGGRNSLEGNMTSGGYGSSAADRSLMNSQMGFWSAFGTGGFPDEPSLMEELGVNLPHILDKSLTVLNPLHSYSAHHAHDAHMMDDTDLAGPLLFCFAFGMMLLLAGKSQFGYIYGVALIGDFSIYLLLNMMSDKGIDAYRVASVLGYCILPLTLLSFFSIFVTLDGYLGYVAAPIFILWCSSSASGIFVSILGLSEQRFLIAYPLGLLYSSFAILSIFDFSGAAVKRI
ncbi:hypothetical protein L7F22_050265 [Adiantum nelumboides]|nr:hypothetical protein [Adiantum nelumboides]